MTQLSQVATVQKLNISNERVKVLAHFREQGSVLQGTKEGRCEGFEIELSLDSEEADERIAEMIRLAHRMCFTEDTLSQIVPTTTSHVVNGQALQIAEENV